MLKLIPFNLGIGLSFILGLSAVQWTANPVQAADAVVCVNCSSEVTQLLNKATMVKQLATQAQQLQAEISQFQDMVTNSKGVSTQIWGKAMQDFAQLQSLMQRSKALAGSASNLDGQFSSRYGTYGNYLNQKMGTHDWHNKYSQWSQEGSDNALYTLKGLGLQASQMQNEQALMKNLQGMAGSASGRMQALQVANMISAQNVDQVFKLRQLMMMQLQMQANYLAQQQDKAAADLAARQNYFKVHRAVLNGERF
jgi:P-type conjugative transfer protein TrbJ